MIIFDRSVTSGLKKRIAIFKRNADGSYTHKTYGSLLDMPEADRLEYIINAITSSCFDVSEEQIAAQRDSVNRVFAQKFKER